MNKYLLTFELETQDAEDRILFPIRYHMERFEEGLYCGSRWSVTTDGFAVQRDTVTLLRVTVSAERIEHAAEDATGHVEFLMNYEYEPKLVRIEVAS